MLPKIQYGYPWGVNIVFSAIGFILIGHISRKWIDCIKEMRKPNKNIIIISTIILGGLGTLLYMLNIPEGGYVNMSESIYGNYALFYLIAICGGAFVVGVSLLLEKIKCFEKLLSYVGRNSLIIFVTHKPVVALFVYLFQYICLPKIVQVLIALGGVMCICCIVANIINIFVPVLHGK